MFKFSTRFCLWHLLAALASLSIASSQSNSRTPSQRYDAPQRPPAAVLPTRFPTPQSRPPALQIPTLPPIRHTDLFSQNQIVTRRTFPQSIGIPNLPSAPPASFPAQPDRSYTEPDLTRAPSNQFIIPGVPPLATYDFPRPDLPNIPSQLYEKPHKNITFPTTLSTPHYDVSTTTPRTTRPSSPVTPRTTRPSSPATPPAGTPPTMMGMPYDFDWDVKDLDSSNIYSHVESSDGDVTRGEYRVLLPDGRLQIVQFVDRGNGYEAKVSYEVYNG